VHHCHQIDDPLEELYDLLICTGMRKGEALGLHWSDVDLDGRLLFAAAGSDPGHRPRRTDSQWAMSATTTGSTCPAASWAGLPVVAAAA
jgi:integrase